MADKDSKQGAVSAGTRGVAIGGNATGNVIVTGDGNAVKAEQGATIEAFTRLLAELRQAVANADLDPEIAEEIDTDLKKAERQAAQPEPKGSLILKQVKGVADLLSSLTGAAESVGKLLPLASKAAEMAGRLFPV